MSDRSIPYHNLIMKCTQYSPCDAQMPEEITLRLYEPGDETAWARLEYVIGDFSSTEEAKRYFVNTYMRDLKKLREHCVFAVNAGGEVVGTCTAWHDRKETGHVASLHWLAVLPEYRGMNIGKALCNRVMEIFGSCGETPVYIHTQPWSYPAVMLYSQIGFIIQKTETFASYVNEYAEAMDTLQSILSMSAYERLRKNAR